MFRLLLQLHSDAAEEAEAVTTATSDNAAVDPATAPAPPPPPLLPLEDPDWTQRRRIRAELHLFRIERGTAASASAAAAAKSKDAGAVKRDREVESRAATPVQSESDSATDSNPASAAAAAASATTVPVSPLPQPTDSRQLLVVAVPHLLSSSHLLQELAGLGFSTVSSATRIVCPRTGQHSLLLRFHTSADADTFFQRIHNHPFHALRREVAYVFQLAEGAVEERAIDPSSSDAQQQHTVVAAAGSLELPCCPRCLSKLDSSLTEIVSELEDCSLVRVRSHRTNQWRTHRVPIWPEIRCETCSIVAAQANGNTTTLADARTACRACIAAPAASAAAAESCASASPLDSAQSLSRSTSTVHSSDNSLWICLLCSHIGCGRYASSGAAHAFAHHLATGHNWAMELTMGAIWDYRNDGYIHRVHGAAATAASAAAAAAAASIAESAARSHARARKAGSGGGGGGEQKEDGAGASSSDESDAEQQQQLLHWTRWNELPAATAGASSASAPTSAPSALTRSSSAGFSLTDPSSDAGAAASDADLRALSLSAAASATDDDLPSYGLDSEEASALLHSKLESIASFYNHLLTHTLQSQYEFFTQRHADLKEDEEKQQRTWEPQIAAQTTRDREAAAILAAEVEALDQSNRALDRAVRDLSSKVTKLTEENAFVKDLNTRMLQDQMAQRKATAAASSAASPVKAGGAASSPSTPAAAATTAASASPAPSTPSSGSSAAATASSSLSSPPPPSTPVSAAASASPATSSPTPASSASDLHLQLDPSLVSKYATLRDQKSRRTLALEKEVARLMEAIEAKSAKEAAAAAAKEAARKERVKRSMVGGIGGGGANSSASARGRRG